MNIELEFRNYLEQHDAKNIVSKIIADGVEEYKSHPAYEWYDNGCDYDRSGSVRCLYGKTIGDICTTDIEILQALTGQSEATYMSGCGLSWNTVAHELCYRITDRFSEWTHDFIFENKQEVCKELKFDEELNDDNYIDLLDLWEIINGVIFHEWFPTEYTIPYKKDKYEWEEELFDNIW